MAAIGGEKSGGTKAICRGYAQNPPPSAAHSAGVFLGNRDGCDLLMRRIGNGSNARKALLTEQTVAREVAFSQSARPTPRQDAGEDGLEARAHLFRCLTALSFNALEISRRKVRPVNRRPGVPKCVLSHYDEPLRPGDAGGPCASDFTVRPVDDAGEFDAGVGWNGTARPTES